jgi:hypothetical protein
MVGWSFWILIMKIKSNLSVVLLSIGFAICFLGCIFFAHQWIDTSITLAYLDTSSQEFLGVKRALALLENEWLGISEAELLKKLEAESDRQPDENIVIFKDDESNTIVFDTIHFEFESGKLKRIKLSTWGDEEQVPVQPQN